MRDAKILRREPSGALEIHADLSSYVGGHLNDMVVDSSGRAYVGDFGFDVMGGGRIETASLLLVQPDGAVEVAARDLWFPNGCAITPDGKTLILTESLGNRISAFDINPQDGTLGVRRDWARFGDLPTNSDLAELNAAYMPDGCCLDAEGCLWFADASGQRLVRLREGGEVLEQIDLDIGVFACVLGGPDGRTLFACAAPDFFEKERMNVREAKVIATQVNIPRVGFL